MDVFWLKGYEATSVQDLVDGTGVNRQSLYDTFGDKHRLYLAALDRYRERHGGGLSRLLDAPGEIKPVLRSLFMNIVDEAVADKHRRGCFMNNATIEMSARCEQAAARLACNMEQMERTLRLALARAKKTGELRSEHNPRALARFLISAIHGLHAMSKTTRDRRTLEDIARVTLSALD